METVAFRIEGQKKDQLGKRLEALGYGLSEGLRYAADGLLRMNGRHLATLLLNGEYACCRDDAARMLADLERITKGAAKR